MSLAARYLEASGIATVILGSARDVVEHCGVPRFVFTDFPLGNPCGRPGDAAMQRQIVEQALSLLETANRPRTTVQTPFTWGDDEWRESYARIDPRQEAELLRLGEQRRAEQRRWKHLQEHDQTGPG